MKILNDLTGIIAKFKFLVSFSLSIAIALAPSFYAEYKRDKDRNQIYFRYEIFQDIGLTVLKDRYAHVGSLSTLVDKYKELVRSDFNNKKFTVSVVMRKATVQVPMNVAITLIEQLHNPTIEMIKRPYLAKFSFYNNSEKSINIKKIVIASDDAYPNPVWDVYFDYPYEKNCTIKHTIRNCIGYVLIFKKQMLLPVNKKLQLFIFFPDLPVIKQDKSFTQISENGDADFVIPLFKEQKINIFDIYRQFAIRILTIFFIILGLAYLSIMIIKNIQQAIDKNRAQK